MPANDQTDSVATLVALVAELVREKRQAPLAEPSETRESDTPAGEAHRLITAYSTGEISRENIVNELAARYQTGVAGMVQALAEFDPKAARELGERLRGRLDEALAAIASRDTGGNGASAQARGRSGGGISALQDRSDVVLLREYVLVSAFDATDMEAKAASLIQAAKALEPGLTPEAVTAHLLRLVNSGIIGKLRKGRYHATPATRSHAKALSDEIEQRGLKLPVRPILED